MEIKVIQSPNGLPSINVTTTNIRIHDVIRRSVLDTFMNSKAYQARIGSGAFLQGQSPNWTFVEFWGNDYQPFVDYLDSILANEDV